MKKQSETEVVHIRMPRELVKLIDHYAVEKGCFRFEAITELTRLGLKTTGFQWPQPKQS